MNKIIALFFLLTLSLVLATSLSIRDLPNDLRELNGKDKKAQVLDSSGKALSITFENQYNLHLQKNLNQIPEFLKSAFIISEDQRFYSHSGVDWFARLNAVLQKFKKVHRGASTITEQVVRMINPRPRTIWSRWVEGFEALKLEKLSSKNEIFSFYLNQVPYSARRRGVAQASLYYFNRSLDTLSFKEMLALVVFVRAPNSLKLNSDYFEKSILLLAKRLHQLKIISDSDLSLIKNDKIALSSFNLEVDASHFVKYVLKNSKQNKFIKTSLVSSLQIKLQELIEEKLKNLKNKNAKNAAILVVDNKTSSIQAWVNSKSNGFHDAVRIRRQAGSTLKPFLYSLALKKGWNAATVINDAPIDRAVGLGLHAYKNYSRTFYGPLRLRLALANSLNSTAIRTIEFVGSENFLNNLRELDFKGLSKSIDFYGDGLALGNAEVSLFELVQAYKVLANKGILSEINFNYEIGKTKKIFDSKITSLIANILSDAQARSLEFGSLLDFPTQTAIKTGTSNDFKDAWAIGFTTNHTVGVWMGNLNRESMKEVSGAQGPASLLRSIFAEINRDSKPQGLFLDPELITGEVCSISGKLAHNACNKVSEIFSVLPDEICSGHLNQEINDQEIYIKYPSPGLNLAMDPRIPDSEEAFLFRLNALGNLKQVEWFLDGRALAVTKDTTYRWLLQPGQHELYAVVHLDDNKIHNTTKIKFVVK